MAYFNNSVKLFSLFFPSLLWKVDTLQKEIYLTFDDGPIPEVTDFVLEQLKIYNAKATFFCVGDNIKKYPEQFLKIVLSGHSTGNHTFHHLKGWDTVDEDYFQDIDKCDKVISENLARLNVSENQWSDKKLLRPPYGKIRNSQSKKLKEEYKIVMWNVLTGDFDQKQKPDVCFKNAVKYTTPGSIVIFHDSLKAEKNLRYALPAYLDYFTSRGYTFKKL